MEGVVVTAKQTGSTVAVSVVSDEKGRFSFPASRLQAGDYALRIRAVGYELDGPRTVKLAAATGTAVDLKLNKTKNLSKQLTNAEWMMSVPGTPADKLFLDRCTSCHTLERPVRSTYNADDFLPVLLRMGAYAPGPPPAAPPQRLDARPSHLATARPQPTIPRRWCGPGRGRRGGAAWVERNVDVSALTFVGSSLGGFYATHLAEKFGAHAVLINPAIHPHLALEPWLGTQTNLHTNAPFEVASSHFAELAAIKVARITRPDRYFLLVETGDEVLDFREAVEYYGGGFQYVRGGGEHAFTEFVMQIPAILRFAGVAQRS